MKLHLLMIAIAMMAQAQSLEPDTDNVFYALAHGPDRLMALDARRPRFAPAPHG